jgi:hypothetical protein
VVAVDAVDAVDVHFLSLYSESDCKHGRTLRVAG